MLSPKRIALFCGHYGSGKTNIAVNYALWLKENGKDVAVADMDIVSPYFRTKDSEDDLNKAGIELVSPHFANSNVDLPSLPQELYGLFQRKDKNVVLDIGGDDRGAYALGRYVPYILEENNFDCFFVANFYRPLTRNAEDSLEVMREIEIAGKVPFTGIINNSNIGEDTTKEDVEKTFPIAEELSVLTGLPVVMVTAEKSIAKSIDAPFVLPLSLQSKYWA